MELIVTGSHKGPGSLHRCTRTRSARMSVITVGVQLFVQWWGSFVHVSGLIAHATGLAMESMEGCAPAFVKPVLQHLYSVGFPEHSLNLLASQCLSVVCNNLRTEGEFFIQVLLKVCRYIRKVCKIRRQYRKHTQNSTRSSACMSS